MSERFVVVESDGKGLRAALLIDRRLEAIEIDSAAHPTGIGGVGLARAIRTLSGLGSIVRLNDGTEALLERGRSPGAPSDGDTLTVQILRDRRGDKLPLASRSVARAGRALIHLPFETGVKASRRLDLPPERRTALEARLGGHGGAWIIRSAASLTGDADCVAEIEALASEGTQATAGSALAAPDAVRRLFVDHTLPAPDRIHVSGRAAIASATAWCKNFAPSLLDRIEPHSGAESLFDLHDLDSAIDGLAEPKVALPGGGSIVIERTEALTAIDVNAGPEANLLAVNIAAAAEIARQLRLRHVGGIVVIDFVSMARPADRARTESTLRSALAHDPAQTHILPMSSLGLVELSRERRGPELELRR